MDDQSRTVVAGSHGPGGGNNTIIDDDGELRYHIRVSSVARLPYRLPILQHLEPSHEADWQRMPTTSRSLLDRAAVDACESIMGSSVS